MELTMFNCKVIKMYRKTGAKAPKQINFKCEGYNTKYYWPDGKYKPCDECKLNIKNNRKENE